MAVRLRPAHLLMAAVVAYLLLPVVAVVLYSFATSWTSGILPDGYTLGWWADGLTDPRLISAFGSSLLLASLTAVIDLCIVVPAAYWARARNPRIRPLIELGAAIPFCLPYLVIAFGILQLAGVVAPGLQGTFLLLLAGHVAIAFPFVYWAVDGAMASVSIERLAQAAEACGASPLQTIRRVVVPTAMAGVVSGAMLAFATSFGEFAMVQIIGRGVETVPLWSAEALRSYSAESGRFNVLAAVTLLTFAMLFALSAAIVYMNRDQTVRLLPGAGMRAAVRET